MSEAPGDLHSGEGYAPCEGEAGYAEPPDAVHQPTQQRSRGSVDDVPRDAMYDSIDDFGGSAEGQCVPLRPAGRAGGQRRTGVPTPWCA